VAADPGFFVPASVEEALGALRDEDALAVAGGTSVGLLLGQSLIEPSVLVWLNRIPGLRDIGEDGAGLTVGATVTLRELSRHPVIRSSLPALADAAGMVGNPRVRAVATVGGALAHADPGQDLPPALVALGATVRIAGPEGTRTVPAAELAVGLMETVLDPGELITSVRIPIVPGMRSVYLRFTPGSAADYPTVAAAACASRGPDGILASVTLSLGGVHRTVLPVPEAASLAGQRAPSAASVAAVAEAAARRARPVASRLGSVAYKRAMAAVWAGRALTACLAVNGEPANQKLLRERREQGAAPVPVARLAGMEAVGGELALPRWDEVVGHPRDRQAPGTGRVVQDPVDPRHVRFARTAQEPPHPGRHRQVEQHGAVGHRADQFPHIAEQLARRRVQDVVDTDPAGHQVRLGRQAG
jgi:carbon-monoxide dehydrogenase medium subunit